MVHGASQSVCVRASILLELQHGICRQLLTALRLIPAEVVKGLFYCLGWSHPEMIAEIKRMGNLGQGCRGHDLCMQWQSLRTK
jgi:hypothetical protein